MSSHCWPWASPHDFQILRSMANAAHWSLVLSNSSRHLLRGLPRRFLLVSGHHKEHNKTYKILKYHNNFFHHTDTNLAALYSSEGSVMERHHLAQAMSILNTEGCDILESLPRGDFDRAIMMLRDNILATDLANYFK